jgi:tetratricopeptide (TPR) repeat protein
VTGCCEHDSVSGDYFDLGTGHRPVTTSSPEAQSWFDRGLAWTYGFHHEEARRCFERAIEADPDCAMAHWGIAYVVGPNYNYAWDAFDSASLSSSLTTARDARENAERLAPSVSEVERALIATLAARYPVTDAAEGDPGWCEQHAHAMREVYRRFPDDLDVSALFAESMMNVTPWQLWDLPTGQPAEGAHTVEIRQVLERALETPDGRRHPGVLHMYLHLMEMSPTPEAASEAGDLLRDLVPDAGHLRHMPSHVDVLTGDYRAVIEANEAAYEADQRYVAAEGAMNAYTLYRCHDLHFLVYGAMFLGDRGTALDAADRLVAAIPESLLRVESPPMADLLEAFVPVRVHAMIRFGMWDELIAEPPPQDHELYAATTAFVHYGRGVAYSATGRVAEPSGSASCSGRRRPACPGRGCCSTTPSSISSRSPRRCWTASWSTAGVSTTRRSRRSAAASTSTTTSRTTSPGAGCSPPGTRTGPCCSSRATWRRPRRSIAPTSASTTPCPERSGTRATSGACTGTTSA